MSTQRQNQRRGRCYCGQFVLKHGDPTHTRTDLSQIHIDQEFSQVDQHFDTQIRLYPTNSRDLATWIIDKIRKPSKGNTFLSEQELTVRGGKLMPTQSVSDFKTLDRHSLCVRYSISIFGRLQVVVALPFHEKKQIPRLQEDRAHLWKAKCEVCCVFVLTAFLTSFLAKFLSCNVTTLFVFVVKSYAERADELTSSHIVNMRRVLSRDWKTKQIQD